jgi:hypothetical protein
VKGALKKAVPKVSHDLIPVAKPTVVDDRDTIALGVNDYDQVVIHTNGPVAFTPTQARAFGAALFRKADFVEARAKQRSNSVVAISTISKKENH